MITESENAKFLFDWKEGFILLAVWVVGTALSPLIELIVLGLTLAFFCRVFS